jgi:c(7)-type cytochrome triheme protein
MNGRQWRIQRCLALLSIPVGALLGVVHSLDASAFLRATPKSAVAAPDAAPDAPRPDAGHDARRILDESDVHDPDNPEAARLQRIGEATRDLPYDATGFPDWMRALSEGLIQPRSDLRGTQGMEVLDLDIIMKNTKEMPHVRFPHRSHTLWLACANCHPAPFASIAGSTHIRMSDIFRGQYCGMCHDRVAFITFFSCNRCHSESPPAQGK